MKRSSEGESQRELANQDLCPLSSAHGWGLQSKECSEKPSGSGAISPNTAASGSVADCRGEVKQGCHPAGSEPWLPVLLGLLTSPCLLLALVPESGMKKVMILLEGQGRAPRSTGVPGNQRGGLVLHCPTLSWAGVLRLPSPPGPWSGQLSVGSTHCSHPPCCRY